jgi:hypothetical protein
MQQYKIIIICQKKNEISNGLVMKSVPPAHRLNLQEPHHTDIATPIRYSYLYRRRIEIER